MTKRYREVLDRVDLAQGEDGTAAVDDAPTGFAWRGREYDVLRVIGHWREDPGWWRRPDGEPIRIEQADLWRVEAGRCRRASSQGVYELVRRGQEWRLDRVWD